MRKNRINRAGRRKICVENYAVDHSKQSERFEFADDPQHTLGQKRYTLAREALGQLLQLIQGLFAQGQSHEQILERLMPA